MSSMEPEHSALLNKHRVAFINDMRPDVIVDHLLASSILLDHHENEIMKNQTSEDKNRVLLRILKGRGKLAFEKFTDALEQTNQHKLVGMLKQHEWEDLDGIATAAKRPKLAELESFNSTSFAAAQSALKILYKNSFKKVNPFSQPFTFDIEQTWVPLAFRKNWPANGQARRGSIEDHCQLIKEAFMEGKQILLIEGGAASGKTSLMRRIAFDWSTGKVDEYKFLFYVEIRNLPKQEFPTLASVVQQAFQTGRDRNVVRLAQEITNEQFCRDNRILVLIDGFDEAQVEEPCVELSNFFVQRGLREPLLYDIVISTRPGPLSKHLIRRDILNSTEVLGFLETKQQSSYIKLHFRAEVNKENKIKEVEKYLNETPYLREIAETPLLLMFICLVYDKIESNTVFELYRCIIWWSIDRYQTDYPAINVPRLLGYEMNSTDNDKWEVIRTCFLEFSVLQKLGAMAYRLTDSSIFSQDDLKKYEINDAIANVGLLTRYETSPGSQTKKKFTFLHRTVQEFLALEAYNFWPKYITGDYRMLSRSSLHIQMFSEPGVLRIREEKSETSGLEVFMWRENIILDSAIGRSRPRDLAFFEKYASLMLGLSITLTQEISVSHLIKISQKWSKLKQIRLKGYSNVGLKDRIDFSSLTSLEALLIDGIPLSTRRSFQKALSSEQATARIFDLPSTRVAKDFVFRNLIFSNAQCFVDTMRYLSENVHSEVTVLFYNTAVRFGGREGIDLIWASSLFWSPSTHPLDECSSITDIVLHCFANAEEIDITACKAGIMRTVQFDIIVPLLINLKTLKISYYLFNERKETLLDVIRFPLCKMKNLESLEFEACKFDLSTLQLIFNNICTYCKNVREVAFIEQSFENQKYFVEFFQIVQQCESIEELDIKIAEYDFDNMEVEKLKEFDATEIFCDLVRHQKRLEILRVNRLVAVIDAKKVVAAAASRKNFVLREKY